MKANACIILPTYNEAGTIEHVIKAIFKQQEKINSHTLSILVVDDNSKDATPEIVQACMHSYPKLYMITGEKKGLGDAYKRGMNYALKELSPELIFEMDADGQHDPKLIPLFVVLANHGFSLVIGSRFAPGGSTPDFSLRRRVMSIAGNWMIRILGGIPRIQDCTSGFRCIKAELIPKCNLTFLSTRGYSFQSSLLCELLRNGAKVIEVPIIFPDRCHGTSKLSIKDQVEFLFNIAKIRFRQSEEFVKFCTVGFLGVFINLGFYILFTRYFLMDLRLASPLAIEISIIHNFLFHHNWTFEKRKNRTSFLKKGFQFHLISWGASLVNYLVFIFFTCTLGLYDIFANTIGICIGIIINYSFNSLWTWKEITLGVDMKK